MSGSQPFPLAKDRIEREESIEARVKLTVQTFLKLGITPSFYSVAEVAQVARSTLYRRPELKLMIEEGRKRSSSKGLSLLEKIKDLKAESIHLNKENEKLRELLSYDMSLPSISYCAIERETDSRFEYFFMSIESGDAA